MENWINRQRLVIFSVLLGVMGIGTYVVQKQIESKEQAGKSALYQVQKSYEEENKTLTESERSAGSGVDVDAKFSKTVKGLNDILGTKTSGSRTLFEAAFRLGGLYLEHGQAEKASVALRDGVQFASSGLQKASIQYLLGSSYEQVEKFAEAKNAFQEGLSQNVAALKSDFLLGLVRSNLKLKNPEEARKIFEQIKKELPGSGAVDIANALMKDLK